MSEAVDFAAVASAAAAAKDYTIVSEGGNFKRELPDAGIGLVRLREYLEIGVRECASKNYPDKKPAEKARFVFELVTPRHVKTVTNEETKETFKISPTISIVVPLSVNEKSNYIKLFKQLNWDGKATHPAQCLGRAYLCEVVLAGASKGPITKDNPAKYANLQKDGVYTLQPPRKVDALAGTSEDLNAPELLNDKKLFIWAQPNMQCWDALYIDGTYEKDGEQVSKNWMQEMLKEALDFNESPLFELLNGGVLDLPTEEPVADKVAAPVEKVEEGPADPLAGLC